jgi:hypothetical protein
VCRGPEIEYVVVGYDCIMERGSKKEGRLEEFKETDGRTSFMFMPRDREPGEDVHVCALKL